MTKQSATVREIASSAQLYHNDGEGYFANRSAAADWKLPTEITNNEQEMMNDEVHYPTPDH